MSRHTILLPRYCFSTSAPQSTTYTVALLSKLVNDRYTYLSSDALSYFLASFVYLSPFFIFKLLSRSSRLLLYSHILSAAPFSKIRKFRQKSIRMLQRRHHSIRVDEKFLYHVSNHESIPQPELDLYRSTLTIDCNGSRKMNRLGAKSRWRPSLLESEVEEKHTELAKEKLGWFDKEKQHVLEELKEQIAGLDRAKGDVLRGLGEKMEGFFGTLIFASIWILALANENRVRGTSTSQCTVIRYAHCSTGLWKDRGDTVCG